jgi:signal transduction histidine kinase
VARRTSGAVTRRAHARKPGNAAISLDLAPAEKRALTVAEISALAKINRIATSSMPAHALLESVTAALKPLISWDRVVIALKRPADGALQTFFQSGITLPGNPEKYLGAPPGSVANLVMTERRPWVNSHIDESTLEQFPKIRSSVEAGVRSWLSAPLLADDSCIGVFHIQSLHDGAYGQRHVRLAQAVAAQIVGALRDRVTVETLRTEAELARTLVEERALVAELGQTIHSSPDLDDVYRPFAEKLRQLVQYDGITLVTCKPDTGEWELRLDAGIAVPAGRRTRGNPGDSTFTSHLLEQRRPLLLSIQTDSEARETAARFPTLRPWLELGIKSLLSAPLIIGDRPVGALHLRSMQPAAYSERHMALIEQVAIYVASAVNNAVLVRRQTEQAELRAAIAEIGNAVVSSLNIEEVYPRFVESVRKVIPWDRIIVNTLRSGDASYRERYWAGVAVSGRQPGDIVQLAGTFTERVLRERRPLILSLKSKADIAAAEKEFPGLRLEIGSGLRSFMTTPLMSGEGVIGTFSVRSFKDGAYTAEHAQLMQQVATHLATALTNADLHARLSGEAQEKTLIAQLGRILSSSVHIKTVLPEFFETLKRLLPAERLVVTVAQPESNTFEDKYILGKAIPGWDEHRVHTSPALPAHIVMSTQKGRLIPTADIAAARPDKQPGLAASYAVGLKSALFAPLISGGRVIGTINVKSERENAYTSSDVELLERVAQQVAGSVQVAENFEQMLAAATDRERRVRAEAEAENLEREAREKSRFITQVGHELRTPLTTVLAFADILRRNRTSNLSEDQLQKLRVMQRNGRRLAVLIDDLLDLSRIEAGSYVLQNEKLDVAEFVRSAAQDLRPVLAAQKQKLTVKAPKKPLSIYADQQRLTQVLSSLVTNASSYSPEGSTITVSVAEQDGEVAIAVSDHGIGIAPEEQSRVFNLFYRVDNEKTRSVAGTGIGLYVAKTLVEAHGGRIRVDPLYREGARLVMTLPDYDRAAGAGGEQAA